MERPEPREMPQTPCPLVHPFPSWVPKPTSSPPATTAQPGAWSSIASGSELNHLQSHAPNGSVSRNASRHARSPVSRSRARPKIPLIPATRPATTSISDVDTPIKRPPKDEETGVKSVTLCPARCPYRRTPRRPDARGRQEYPRLPGPLLPRPSFLRAATPLARSHARPA
jgi:hypothetical protein